MSAIPAHCPYRSGDRVQMHGFPGYHAARHQAITDRDVIGFRGVVTGYIGGTVLVGQTDDGRGWAEEWGGLDRDGTRCHDSRCGCCPHVNGRCQPELADPARAQRAAADMAEWLRTGVRPIREQYGQLDLFAEIGAHA